MKPRTWADGNPTGALRRAYELMDELDAIKSEKEKNSRGNRYENPELLKEEQTC